jgi:hypothetical protein
MGWRVMAGIMKTNNQQKTNQLKSNSFYKTIMNFIDETNFVYLYIFPFILGVVFITLATLIVNNISHTERTGLY